MDLTFKLESFEGPLELLFHLIEKNKIDIYDIPIALLTEQYLEYLDNMEKTDMDSLSEFMVMAATLIEIKSKMLLPKPQLEEEEEVDPREELVSRLIEYKRFKMLAEQLSYVQDRTGHRIFRREDKEIIARVRKDVPKEVDEILNGADMDMLFKAFSEVLKRKEVKVDKIRSTFKSVTRETFTIEGKIEYIENMLKLKGEVKFSEFFRPNSSRNEKIATFLAMLELIKIKKIFITQKALFDEIIIVAYKEVR